MRVLVECSGYELLNVGDVAMLQVGVGRLRRAWPEAEISVVTNAPELLARYCPGIAPVAFTWPAARRFDRLPPRAGAALTWRHKVSAPNLVGGRAERLLGRDELLDAIRGADAVVSTGGGLSDAHAAHGRGVLAVLAAAQRLGLPTAMFGQGIGPLTSGRTLRSLRAVAPRLAALGLRDSASLDLLREVGLDAARAVVTGDDALEIAGAGQPPAAGAALGINVGADLDGDASVGLREVLGGFIAGRAVEAVALPADRRDRVDLNATAKVLPQVAGIRHVVADLQSPSELAAAIARCRAVLTANYHVAVFALARGIPVVGLSRSRHDGVSFDGLASLFPAGACRSVAVGQWSWPADLTDALKASWEMGIEQRAAIAGTAAGYAEASAALYARAGVVGAPDPAERTQ